MEDNMKSGKWILVISALLLVLAGCSNNMTGSEEVSYPKWWNTQDDANYICSYGMATKESQTVSIDSSTLDALQQSALYVETQVKTMMKDFEEESGVKDPQVLALTQSVIKVTANATFSGVLPGSMMTRKTVEKGETRYTTYAQMKVPKVEISRNLIKNIRNEEALYNQFKASQAFQELDEEFFE